MSGRVPQDVASIERVLSSIPQLCSQMNEMQTSCERLYGRLQTLFTRILSTGAQRLLSSNEPLAKYAELLSQYVLFLNCHRTKDFIHRVIAHQSAVDELRQLNEDVSVLFRGAGIPASTGWEGQFMKESAELCVLAADTAAVVHELQEPRVQVEAWLTLKFEMERRSDQHREESMELMRVASKTVSAISTITLGPLPVWFLPATEVTVEAKPFGRGPLGSVFRGVLSSTPVAVKFFRTHDAVADEGKLLKLEKELNLLYEMNHPNLVKILGACHVSLPPFIVYEDIPSGNFSSFLARSDDNKQQMWGDLHQAAIGLEYIHKRGLVHGDLKLSNILVSPSGQVKLTDFGLNALRAYCSGGGTVLRWSAPECLKRRPTSASDVYSLAMCIVEAVTGEPPFAFLGVDDVRDLLRNGGVIDKPDELADHAWKLVEAMLKADRKGRPQLQEVIEKLEFLADVEALGREDLSDAMGSSATDVLEDTCQSEGNQQKRSTETARETQAPKKKRMRHK